MLRDKGGVDFEPAPAGTHIGRCYQIIGLGTKDNEYQGQHFDRTQIFIGFELPNAIKEYEKEVDGQKVQVKEPFSVGAFFTETLNEKGNLRRDLTSWRGKEFTAEELEGFDEAKLLGVPCLLSIIHKEKTGSKTPKAVITGYSRLMEGQECPPAVNTSVLFQIGDLNDWTQEAFDKVPKGFQNMIMQSYEYKERMNGGGESMQSIQQPSGTIDSLPSNDFDDDIPF